MNWDWVASGIAVLAAVAAFWQAWEARRARNQAAESSAEAKSHEQRAADAAERQAKAIEESTALTREAMTAYKMPWVLKRESKERWKLSLTGSEEAHGVRINLEPDNADMETWEPVPETMRPGDAVFLMWSKGFGSPSQITIEVYWRRPGETEERVVRETVM